MSGWSLQEGLFCFHGYINTRGKFCSPFLGRCIPVGELRHVVSKFIHTQLHRPGQDWQGRLVTFWRCRVVVLHSNASIIVEQEFSLIL